MIITNSKKLIDKIIEFWEEEMPYVIGPARMDKFFRQAAIQVVMEFIEKKENDFKNYPWNEKIFEKRRELFGF